MSGYSAGQRRETSMVARASLGGMALSPLAELVLRSLCDYPDENTPERIANGMYAPDDYGVREITNGLHELAGHSLAFESHGTWALTSSGRERCPEPPH